jgi:hypothetical protein
MVWLLPWCWTLPEERAQTRLRRPNSQPLRRIAERSCSHSPSDLDAGKPMLATATVARIVPAVRSLEGRRPVAFGDVVGVEGAFGVDAVGAVLCAGATAGGHHHAAIAGRSIRRWGSGQFTG